MDVYNIEHQTNSTFAQTFVLDAWCDLYDFSIGHWHSHLRRQLASAVVHYEWSTENGMIEFDESNAVGWISFTNNPDIGEAIMIGATVVEFGASDGVVIGATLAVTLANLLAYLEASVDEDLSRCTYDISAGNTLNIIYGTTGGLGNSFPIEATVAGSTKSGEFLAGGGGVLTMTAPVEDVETFDGDFYYDVRWQAIETGRTFYIAVVGGVITFIRGVTRDTE